MFYFTFQRATEYNYFANRKGSIFFFFLYNTAVYWRLVGWRISCPGPGESLNRSIVYSNNSDTQDISLSFRLRLSSFRTWGYEFTPNVCTSRAQSIIEINSGYTKPTVFENRSFSIFFVITDERTGFRSFSPMRYRVWPTVAPSAVVPFDRGVVRKAHNDRPREYNERATPPSLADNNNYTDWTSAP